MGLKKIIKDTFSDKKDITKERLRAAKSVLVFLSFFFFLNFYFVGAGFYSDIFIYSLGFSYILLLVAFLFYFYFLIKKLLLNSVKPYFFVIIFIVLFLIFSVFSFPIIMDGGLNGLLDVIKLYTK